MANSQAAVRLERIALTVCDLAPAIAFYEQALGFRCVERQTREGAAFSALVGLPDARADVAVLKLGDQEIELAAFSPPGRPYPTERHANDPWFQHFAIVTTDMDAASGSTASAGAAAISSSGPVLLPPATGSITAYKFRDLQGHPLELSYFPPPVAGGWRDPPKGAVFLGIDHSAVAVADIETSLAFYVGLLGLTVAARQVNSGPTQDRLDGLARVEVNIVSLTFPDAGPHLELLHYRQPAPRTDRPLVAANDIAATRLVLSVNALQALLPKLQAEGIRVLSHGLTELEGGLQAVLVSDPDGHLLQLQDQRPAIP